MLGLYKENGKWKLLYNMMAPESEKLCSRRGVQGGGDHSRGGDLNPKP